MAQEHFHQVQEDLRQPYTALREAVPEVMSTYGALSTAAMAEGAGGLPGILRRVRGR